MHDQLLYQEDPLRLEFEAQVREKVSLPGGQLGLILERTYFYPTSGGQEHDTGSIGPARVVDVYKQGEPPVLVAAAAIANAVHDAVGVRINDLPITAEKVLRAMQKSGVVE